jgi:hypothetical protein
MCGQGFSKPLLNLLWDWQGMPASIQPAFFFCVRSLSVMHVTVVGHHWGPMILISARIWGLGPGRFPYLVGHHWGPVILISARIGSPGPGRLPYFFWMIPMGLLGARIICNPHSTQPLINELSCTGEDVQVIGYDWDLNRTRAPARVSHGTKWDKISENNHKSVQKWPLWLKNKVKFVSFPITVANENSTQQEPCWTQILWSWAKHPNLWTMDLHSSDSHERNHLLAGRLSPTAVWMNHEWPSLHCTTQLIMTWCDTCMID